MLYTDYIGASSLTTYNWCAASCTGGSGLSGGAIAGIVIGSLIGVAIIVGVVIFVVKKNKAQPSFNVTTNLLFLR